MAAADSVPSPLNSHCSLLALIRRTFGPPVLPTPSPTPAHWAEHAAATPHPD